jgi:hypothetical protein
MLVSLAGTRDNAGRASDWLQQDSYPRWRMAGWRQLASTVAENGADAVLTVVLLKTDIPFLCFPLVSLHAHRLEVPSRSRSSTILPVILSLNKSHSFDLCKIYPHCITHLAVILTPFLPVSKDPESLVDLHFPSSI